MNVGKLVCVLVLWSIAIAQVLAAPSPTRDPGPAPTRDAGPGPARDLGRVVTEPPPPATAGSFYGTWYHGSRDHRVALWIRPSDGGPEIKLRLFDMNTTEGFETDWDGKATYHIQGLPGQFTLVRTEADDNTIHATWRREVERLQGFRSELANVVFYRSGDRELVLRFDDYERVLKQDETESRLPLQFFWAFRKGSNRLVDWEELPF